MVSYVVTSAYGGRKAAVRGSVCGEFSGRNHGGKTYCENVSIRLPTVSPSQITHLVSTLEPIAETKLATRLKSRRQLRASVAAKTTVLGSPTRSRSTPLSTASVEETNTATRDGEIELALADISAGVGGLDDHLLAGNRGGSERELVARAAGVGLGEAGGDGGEAVCEVVGDDPGRLVGAHVGISALARGGGVEVGEGRVVLVADGYGVRDVGLVGPRAGALAAVPLENVNGFPLNY
jgi:hypothetical protein